jgi:hypothetical protein
VSITLSIQVDDPQVEKLLSILQTQFSISPEGSISLLERTSKWIRATQPVHYDVASAMITLDLSRTAEAIVEQSDTELLPQRG